MNLVTMWREEQFEARERERLHQAYLRGPMPRNPPELMAPVKVRVLKAFGIGGGKVAEPGTEIELPKFDAVSMAALRRVELL
jgi:hypothetical protein